MKLFWGIIVAVLALAWGAVFVSTRGSAAPRDSDASVPAMESTLALRESTVPVATPEMAAATAPASGSSPVNTSGVTASDSAAAAKPPVPAASVAASPVTPAAPPAATPSAEPVVTAAVATPPAGEPVAAGNSTETSAAGAPAPAEAAARTPEAKPDAPGTDDEAKAPEPKPVAIAAAESALENLSVLTGEKPAEELGATKDAGDAAKEKAIAELVAGFPNLKAAKNADGSLLIEDRFTVKGAGTKDDPYQVSWDLLTSVQESYDPRKGQKDVPDRAKFLDGKHIKVTGYVAFPLYVEEPNELLSMLNQWDGCCIGVPPTPYDAIEVKLAKTVDAENRYATYGSLTGVFKVKPYLVGDWLVGLYMLEKAELSDVKTGGMGQ